MTTEHGQAELLSAVDALAGSRVVEVRRTLNIAILGLTRGDESVRLHAQCPFRIVYGDRVVLGSTDMVYAVDRKANPDEAFDRYETQYDRSAAHITTLLAETPYLVTAAELRPAGAIHLDCTGNLQIDVLPAVSGPLECWRLFVQKSDDHFVYESGKK
jgi:hypothetical protein